MGNARPFLISHLRLALRRHADELRFMSGQQPAMLVDQQLRSCGEVATSGALVEDMFEALVAGRPEGAPADVMNFAVTLADVGRFQCCFEAKGGTRALRLRCAPAGDAAAYQVRRHDPPPLAEGAVPEDALRIASNRQ